MGRPPVIPTEEKLRLVLSVVSGEMTIAQAARHGKVSEQSVSRWKQQFLAGAKNPPTTAIARKPAQAIAMRAVAREDGARGSSPRVGSPNSRAAAGRGWQRCGNTKPVNIRKRLAPPRPENPVVSGIAGNRRKQSQVLPLARKDEVRGSSPPRVGFGWFPRTRDFCVG